MKAVENITLDWLHARVMDQDGCLVWSGACGKAGKVPQARIGGQALGMRRVVWQLANDRPVPADRRVSPTCGNSKCIHPDHLKALPINHVFKGVKKSLMHKANMAKARRIGSKWSDEVMREVAASDGKLADVAAQYGMHPSFVSLIRNNKARRDFSNPYAQLLARAA